MERAARGDQEAFEGLIRLSANRLFAIADRILRDPERFIATVVTRERCHISETQPQRGLLSVRAGNAQTRP